MRREVSKCQRGVGETVQQDGQCTVARSVAGHLQGDIIKRNDVLAHAVDITDAGSVTTMSRVSPDDFRRAAGSFPTGVVVVTGVDAHGPVGLTCQSFVSLSLEPLLVSFSVGSAGRSWPRLSTVSSVAISVLAADQEDVARSFSISDNDKFAGAELTWTNDLPLMTGALAHLTGSIVSTVEAGDHHVVIVAVETASSRDGDALTYFRGRFGVLS